MTFDEIVSHHLGDVDGLKNFGIKISEEDIIEELKKRKINEDSALKRARVVQDMIKGKETK